MTELEKFDHRICEIHKKYDEIQAEARAKEEKLREMRDQLADLKREALMVKSNSQDSPQAKEIRHLENRLDKAMIKYNEAQSIRKTYELITKRLQEERLTFDKQLANFEKTLKAKRQDALELEMMSRDANHAKEVAKAELMRFEQQINEERKQREKDLQMKKEMVKQKLDMIEKWDKRSLLDDSTNETSRENDLSKDHYDEAKEKKMSEYEETMRLIKEATGVSAINEVIAKFQGQGDTNAHLAQLQKQNEERIQELKKKKEDVRLEYEELQYSGELKHSHLKKTIEEFEEHLRLAQARMVDAKSKYERTSKLLNNAKSGIQHLYDKLECIPLVDKKSVPMTDETAVTVLDMAVQKLDQLVTNLQGKEIPEPAQTASSQQPPGEPVSILQVSPNALPLYNTRVKLKPIEFEEEIAEDEEENDDEYGDVPDRETIKKYTAQILNAKLKNKQNKKVKKKKTAKDEDD
ncbi:hypothetical protein HK098_007224 [Nowakowskiella sp. JEL0407]|nr:hypothetical protein HK098_007224 [Nowakowskiella sp. JEL0407]